MKIMPLARCRLYALPSNGLALTSATSASCLAALGVSHRTCRPSDLPVERLLRPAGSNALEVVICLAKAWLW